MSKSALTTNDDDVYDDHELIFVSLGLKSTPFISNFIAKLKKKHRTISNQNIFEILNTTF